MAGQKPIPDRSKTISVDFPMLGLDETRAFQKQRTGTTPDASNVCGFDPGTDRARGGSREGISKYVPGKVNGTNSIQDTTDTFLATSSVTAQGVGYNTTGTGVIKFAGTSDGSTIYTSSALGIAIAIGYDDEGNCYVGGHVNSPNTPFLVKVSPTGTLLWSASANVLGQQSISGNGLVVYQGIVYLLLSASGKAMLFRFTTDGVASDGGAAWKTEADGLPPPGHSGTVMAITGNKLGLGGKIGSNVVLVRVALPTGAVASPVTVKAVSSSGSVLGVAADLAGNFYFSSLVDSTAYLLKIRTDDVVETTLSGGSTVTADGICYDALNDRLGVVGDTSIFGATNKSFATLNPSTGAIQLSANVNSITVWNRIAVDRNGIFYLACATSIVKYNADTATVIWSASKTAGNEIACAPYPASVDGSNIMSSTRVTRRLVVAGGCIRKFTGSAISTITGGEGALNSTAAVVFSAINGLGVYFVDGGQYRVYDGDGDTVSTWAATAGTMPVDSDGERCRLICTWRARTVLSGLRGDPQNIFGSAVNDPTDFDYSPTSQTPTQAFAANIAPMGMPGDLVNCIFPLSDDVLFVGMDHTLGLVRGDPNSGGEIDRISTAIGCAWGRPICMGPDGAIYFMSSRGAVYMMTTTNPPVRMSQQISRRLETINMATSIIRLAYDDRRQGLYVFITPLDSTETTTHFWWEARTNAWWPLEFANTNHNPKVVHVFDGDDPDDRVMLLGSWDGYLRFVDVAATKDDGTNIASRVLFGPILSSVQDEMTVRELQPILADDSGSVTWGVKVGRTANEARDAEPFRTGSWIAARNYSEYVRASGHVVFIEISSMNRWAMEQIRAVIEGEGMVRRRGR